MAEAFFESLMESNHGGCLCHLHCQEEAYIQYLKCVLAAKTETNPITNLRYMCFIKGPRGLLEFVRSCRKFANGKDSMTLEIFANALKDCKLLEDNKHEVERTFQEFDRDASRMVNINEFVKKLRPDIPRIRMDLLEKTFMKLVTDDVQEISFDSFRKSYCPKSNPKCLSGQISEDAALSDMWINLKYNQNKSKDDQEGKITKEDFR